jgi:predicted amidohydrolase
MRDFRIAMMQLNFPQRNSVDENIEKMEKWVHIAADKGADLVMFGELSVSGYLLNTSGMRSLSSGSSEHYRRAEAIPGLAVQRLEAIAKEHSLFIAAGMGDLQAGVVYNAYFIVGPDGYVGKQRKLHMPTPEYPYYGVGSECRVFDIGLCKIGVSICFDNWFPETSRLLVIKGAEVMLSPWMWIIPSNVSPEKKREAIEARRKSLKKFFPARALDNAMYVMVLDHVGLEAENFEFPGVSMAIDPIGDIIAESNPSVEEMVVVDLKESQIEKYRTYGHHYTLKFRRPEIYGELAKMVP